MASQSTTRRTRGVRGGRYRPDDRIYIACRSNYGLAGGGLARFDPGTGEKRAFRDMDQSVQAVAADRRYIYGGTSIRGGRGWSETTTKDRMPPSRLAAPPLQIRAPLAIMAAEGGPPPSASPPNRSPFEPEQDV